MSAPATLLVTIRMSRAYGLLVNMVNLQVSTVLGVAIKEEREQKAWTEGVAIWVAVIVVSLVGECNPCCSFYMWRNH